MKNSKGLLKIILIILLGFILITCQKEEPIRNKLVQEDAILKKGNKKEKVSLCHLTETGDFILIEVNANAVSAHLAHGDMLLDADGDGYTSVDACSGSMDDCNDNDPLIYPGADEICGDGIDNNCNGEIDEECNSGTFIDSRDQHEYEWVKIGEQVWMAENLAYLPEVCPSSKISYAEKYYYVYGYEGTSTLQAKSTENYNNFGALYNLEAAKTDCPDGWHLPSDDEWTVLTNFLGNNAGYKMKSTSGWKSGGDGDNSSRLNVLPSGYLSHQGMYGYFNYLGSGTYFWSSTANWSAYYVWDRSLSYNSDLVTRGSYQFSSSGLSVRCIKDTE